MRALLLLLWRLSPLLKRSCWYVTDKNTRAIDIIIRSLQNMGIDCNFVQPTADLFRIFFQHFMLLLT